MMGVGLGIFSFSFHPFDFEVLSIGWAGLG